VDDLDRGVAAAQDHLPGRLRQLAPGDSDVEVEVLGECLEAVPVEDLASVGSPAGPRGYGTLRDRQRVVGDDEVGVELLEVPESAAVRAGPVGSVEGEGARFEFFEEGAVLGARELLAEQLVCA